MKKLVLSAILVVAFGVLTTNVGAQPFTPNVAGDVYGTAQGGGNIVGVPTPRDNNDGLPDINDAINLIFSSASVGLGPYTRNSDVDFLQFTSPDKFWHDLSTADSTGTFITIGLTAANANSLGAYDPGTLAESLVIGPHTGFGFLGDGSSDPFPAASLAIAPGANFGWYLESVNGSPEKWYSDPARNTNGYDHMLTYHLPQLAGKSLLIGFGCTGEPGSVVCDSTTTYTFHDPYLLAWEDKPYDPLTGKLGDEDYDDTIFLVDRVIPVPEPASMMLLGSGLLGLVGIRRKRS